MACTEPLKAERRDGSVFILGADKRGEIAQWEFRVPCGQCRACRLALAQEWAIRGTHESLFHEHACFVSLTLNDANLPLDYCAHRAPVRGFLKRLRKQVGPIRFLACGEYGPTTHRPHYHLAIFGHGFLEDREKLYTRFGHDHYRTPHLDRLWAERGKPLGFAEVTDFSKATAGYIAKYTVKKRYAKPVRVGDDPVLEDTPGFHSRFKTIRLHDPITHPLTGASVQQTPEWIQASTGSGAAELHRGGLGFAWYQQFGWTDCHRQDEITLEGRTYRPPRYYDKLLERKDPEALARIKQARAEKGLEGEERVQELFGNLLNFRRNRDFILAQRETPRDGADSQHGNRSKHLPRL